MKWFSLSEPLMSERATESFRRQQRCCWFSGTVCEHGDIWARVPWPEISLILKVQHAGYLNEYFHALTGRTKLPEKLTCVS